MKKLTGVQLIAQERQRQIDVEGFDINRDIDNYAGGELAGAACCYATNAINKQATEFEGDFARFQVRKENEDSSKWVDGWPWDKQYDKRAKHDQLRSLVIAGALIAAEIDRLQNMEE